MRTGLSLAFWLALLAPCLGAEIHDAAERGDLEAVTGLLDRGTAIDSRTKTGETPLISAALSSRTEVVVFLLKRGAAVGEHNDRGLTAVHAAAHSGSLPVVTLLVDAGAAINVASNLFKVSPLIVAAEEGHENIVAYLLAHGADIEATERTGYTALSRAIFRDQRETVRTLFRAGAKCQDEKAIGPWHAVCQSQADEMR